MLDNVMTAKDARDNFADLLGAVYYGRQAISVEKKGRVFAVVVNPDDYQRLKEIAKTRFFEAVDEIRKRNKGVNPRKVMRDVTRAVEEVRAERLAKNA